MTGLASDDYSTTLRELKSQVHDARLQVQRAANDELFNGGGASETSSFDARRNKGGEPRSLPASPQTCAQSFPP